ncbi:metallopeptidase [Geofilum rubicundum JCM 15548]|uniref:Metallopeptidase n=1 Tax=Geofilum rubicundum JCM 15548 TaxID=1236989 RepID=A0A0E9M081_9BACT|nr:metallopeptidase [Geofilum rubicundum JCM 15548]
MIAMATTLGACSDGTPKSVLNTAHMDATINPGDDFYQFVNNGWLASNPIPDDYSRYGAFEQLNEENEQKLSDLLTAIRNDETAEPGSNRQKVRDFYNSAMDTVALEEQGLTPLMPFLDAIDQIQSKAALSTALANMHKMGFSALFGMGAAQDRKNTEMMIASGGTGWLGMSDRDYYLKDDARSTEIRENYERFIESIFVLAGASEAEAAEARETIMEMETELAKLPWTA